MDIEAKTKTVSVLGVNGRIGQEVAQAFLKNGWRVIGFGRENRLPFTGVEFVVGDAAVKEDIVRATAESSVVVNCLNLPYDKWDQGRFEGQLGRVLAALKVHALAGDIKTMMFPGNIYNYAEDEHLLTPQTPFNPARDKGKIRVRMERMIEDAVQRGELRSIILRLGDFYGPNASGTYFDLGMLRGHKKGKIELPMEPDIFHSWAYLPDVAKVYVKLAENRDQFEPAANFHFRGHFASGEQLANAVQMAFDRPIKVSRMFWPVVRVMGWFMPIMREVHIMSYLYDQPHQLKDERLDALLGPDFGTPFEEAVVATVKSYTQSTPVIEQELATVRA